MLRKTTLLYLIGEITSKAIPFLLMPYLTRILGVEGFGDLNVYQAWIAFALVIVSYVQDAAIIRYVYFYGKRSVDLIVFVGRVYSTAIAILGVVISFSINSEYLFWVVVCSFSQSILKVELTLHQAFKNPQNYLVILIFSNVVSVALTIAIFEYSEGNAINRIVAITLGSFISAVLSWIFIRRVNFSFQWSKNKIKLAIVYLVSFSSPLLINSIATMCKGQFDRLLIAERFSVAELGEYAAGYQIASIFLLMLLAASRAIEPYCYQAIKNKTLNFKLLVVKVLQFLPLLILPIVISVSIPNSFYVWFLGEGFNNVKIYTIQFTVAFGILGVYMCFSLYLNFFGYTKEIAVSNSISIVFYIFFLYFLSSLGVAYIGLATILSNIVLLVASVFYSYKVENHI
ncbi:oligosaccharide flippase family protein [Vibrio vulnificus]|nr:oligosaccharide flippase family protein [Vibrio vulnificus]